MLAIYIKTQQKVPPTQKCEQKAEVYKTTLLHLYSIYSVQLKIHKRLKTVNSVTTLELLMTGLILNKLKQRNAATGNSFLKFNWLGYNDLVFPLYSFKHTWNTVPTCKLIFSPS